jgi:hypothetical protein
MGGEIAGLELLPQQGGDVLLHALGPREILVGAHVDLQEEKTVASFFLD